MTSPFQLPEAASALDLADIIALEKAAFDHPWTGIAIAPDLEASDTVVLLARREGEVIGWCNLRLAASEAELLRLAVHPDARREGVGQQLLRAGLAEVKERGAVRVFLEVRKDNAPALALYHRFGFRCAGERPGYYRDGTAAVILALDV